LSSCKQRAQVLFTQILTDPIHSGQDLRKGGKKGTRRRGKFSRPHET